VEQDPWLSVIGSDSPTFALYDDGTMISLRDKPSLDDPFQYRSVEGGADVVKALLEFNPTQKEEYFELSHATDQVETMIWTPTKIIHVYGNWRNPPRMGSNPDTNLRQAFQRDNALWASLPPEIRTALARIDQERSIEGMRWLPPKIEVMLWPYECAPDPSIPWPATWPGLSAKETLKRGNAFSVLLPSEKLSELRAFLATRKEKGAVLIDGRKMAAAIRFPFPGESSWMR
jgi:hypothetical protein